MIGSHEMPTKAPPPPASVLNSFGDQCWSSPTRRKIVTSSVIAAGIMIDTRLPELVSAINNLLCASSGGHSHLRPFGSGSGDGGILVHSSGSSKRHARRVVP